MSEGEQPTASTVGRADRAIFTSTAHGITAVDLNSGRISQEIDKIWDDRTVSSPQLFGDLVFGSFGKGLSGQRSQPTLQHRNEATSGME